MVTSVQQNEKAINQIGQFKMRSWVVTLSASLFFFYIFIQLNLFNAIDQELMQFFHLNAPELGQLGSMFFYANALFLFPAGLILDRFSPKKILILATLLATGGTFLFANATTYPSAAIARFIVGIAAAFSFLSCIRIASRWFSPSQMALASGVIVTMAMIGGLVAQTPLALLTHHLGWRYALNLDAALGVVILFAVIAFVKDYPPNTATQEKADSARLQSMGLWYTIKLVLLNPQNWYGGLYTALMNLPVFLLGAIFGIHYLVQVHHVTPFEASYATTVFFVGIIFGAPAFGWLSDHLKRRIFPMFLGALASLVVILILMYGQNLSLSTLMIIFFLIGFLTSSQVLSYPLIAELNPSVLTSTAISVVSVTIMLSGVIFQPLFGWLMQLHWDHVMNNGIPVYSPKDFIDAMLIMPIAFVIAFFIALLMKETNCRSRE